MTEEESVSIASCYKPPVSQVASHTYAILDKDIRHSGAGDIPSVLRADLFFNHPSDLVFTGSAPATGPATFLGNSGSTDICGAEVSIDVLPAGWLSEFADYSRRETQHNYPGTARHGAPSDKRNIGLRAESDHGLSGETVFHHVGGAVYPGAATCYQLVPFGVPLIATRVGSDNLMNGRGGCKFWKQTASAGCLREPEVAISAFNALNDTHREHPLGETTEGV